MAPVSAMFQPAAKPTADPAVTPRHSRARAARAMIPRSVAPLVGTVDTTDGRRRCSDCSQARSSARSRSPYVGASCAAATRRSARAVITSTAFVVAAIAAVPSATEGIDGGDLWPFSLIGAVVPGLSQVLFVLAVRYAGPSRAAILIGTAPLLSVLLALVLLDEPLRAGAARRHRVDRRRRRGADPRAYPAARRSGRSASFSRSSVPASSPRVTTPSALRRATSTRRRCRRTAVSLLAAGASATIAFVAIVRRGVITRVQLVTAVRAFVPAGLMLGLAYALSWRGFDAGPGRSGRAAQRDPVTLGGALRRPALRAFGGNRAPHGASPARSSWQAAC